MKKMFVALLYVVLLVACGSPESPPQNGAQEAEATSAPISIDVGKAMTGPALDLKSLGTIGISVQTTSSITPAVAKQMQTSDAVTLTFSNGEVFQYQNVGGVVNIDGDTAYSSSTDIANLAAAYNSSLSKRATGSVGTLSTIGKRGFVCTFRFIGCWLGFTNIPAWPEKTIYYQIYSMSAERANAVDAAVASWNIDTNFNPKWIKGTNPYGVTTNFVEMSTIFPTCGISPIGYTMQRILPFIFISSNCFNSRTLIHEMGHAAGLNHEHQRCDRDDHIFVEPNTSPATSISVPYAVNFNKLCEFGEDVGKFNYNSIMLYHSPKIKPIDAKNATPDSNYLGNPLTYSSSYDATALDSADISDGLRTLYGSSERTGAIAVDSGTVQPNTTWDAKTQLSHSSGRVNQEAWTMAYGSDTPGTFLSFGPYVKLNGNPNSCCLVAEWDIYVDNRWTGSDVVATLDVNSTINGVQRVMASRPLRRDEFFTNNTYQKFTLPFQRSSSADAIYEFRVLWSGTSYVGQKSVTVREMSGLGSWGMQSGGIGHGIGRSEGIIWSVDTHLDKPGFMQFGPYYNAPQIVGSLRAEWELLIDNNTTSNETVARVEAVTSTGVVLAQRNISRKEFKSAYTYQTFELSFTPTTLGSLYELRVYWLGTAYMRERNVAVRGEKR
jgi:Astacin (Peptidase family M12A)